MTGGDIMLEAYLASTGKRLASLQIQPHVTVAEICEAVSEAISSSAESAGIAEYPCSQRFRAVEGAELLEDTLLLESSGLLEGSSTGETLL
ncbi:unnamed protein product, partial [Symbiodinium pilosum]